MADVTAVWATTWVQPCRLTQGFPTPLSWNIFSPIAPVKAGASGWWRLPAFEHGWNSSYDAWINWWKTMKNSRNSKTFFSHEATLNWDWNGISRSFEHPVGMAHKGPSWGRTPAWTCLPSSGTTSMTRQVPVTQSLWRWFSWCDGLWWNTYH